jgi:hypothetical protein
MPSAFNHLLDQMRLVPPPVMRTVNGFGVRLSGSLADSEMRQANVYVSCYSIVLFFLPLVPIRLYLVSGGRGPGRTYVFHGRVTWKSVREAFGWQAWWLMLSAWIEGLVILLVFGGLVAVLLGARSLLFRR